MKYAKKELINWLQKRLDDCKPIDNWQRSSLEELLKDLKKC
jgi:hypothetical protein